MFPLKSDQPYPRRLWWLAAFSGELGQEILPRTILGDRIVLFRGEDGTAAALYGYCPHRAYPFEKSRIVNGLMQCGYHGFEFDRQGACVHVPTQTGVPANASARAYPIVEKDGLIWIWTGEPELADPSLVPDAGSLGMAPGWAMVPQPVVTIKGRYTLLIDNLLDLSHGSFIHATTIPGSGALAKTPAEFIETEQSLCVHRRGRNLPPNPLTGLMFPEAKGLLDQCFDAEFFSPAFIRTAGDIFESETGQLLGTMNILHFITPETQNSVHYWVVQCRNVATDNATVSAFIEKMGIAIQPEDQDAIEAIEQGLSGMNHAPREISCRVDTGALKVRHRIEKLIAAEA